MVRGAVMRRVRIGSGFWEFDERSRSLALMGVACSLVYGVRFWFVVIVVEWKVGRLDATTKVEAQLMRRDTSGLRNVLIVSLKSMECVACVDENRWNVF